MAMAIHHIGDLPGRIHLESGHHLSGHHHSGGSAAPFLAHIWHRMGETLHTWHDRILARRELAELDDYMLRDIGLTRSDVVREADKPFWRA